jgi:hypothetical protein
MYGCRPSELDEEDLGEVLLHLWMTGLESKLIKAE